MGLRDYLAALQAGSEGAQDFASTAQKLREQGQLQQLAAEAPELLDAGNFNAVASQAAAAGQMGPMNELFQQKIQAGQNKPYTVEQLVAQGLSPEKAGALAPLSYAQQKDAIDNVGQSASRNLTARQIANQEQAQQRLEREETQKQRNAAGKIFGDLEKNDSEEKRAIEKVEAALKTNTITGDAIVMNFIARAMAGEKGPLAEGDITRLVGRSFAGDFAGAQNYVTSLASSTASSAQRQTFRKMLELAKGNYGDWKKEAVARSFGQAIENNPKLVQDGKPDKQLVLKAQRLGYQGVEINENGAPVLIVGKKYAPTDTINKETGQHDISKLEAQAQTIQDPKAKQWALTQIKRAKDQAATGKPLNDASVQALASQMKKYLP